MREIVFSRYNNNNNNNNNRSVQFACTTKDRHLFLLKLVSRDVAVEACDIGPLLICLSYRLLDLASFFCWLPSLFSFFIGFSLIALLHLNWWWVVEEVMFEWLLAWLHYWFLKVSFAFYTSVCLGFILWLPSFFIACFFFFSLLLVRSYPSNWSSLVLNYNSFWLFWMESVCTCCILYSSERRDFYLNILNHVYWANPLGLFN